MSRLATIWQITPRPVLIAVTISVVAVSVLPHSTALRPASNPKKTIQKVATKSGVAKRSNTSTKQSKSSVAITPASAAQPTPVEKQPSAQTEKQDVQSTTTKTQQASVKDAKDTPSKESSTTTNKTARRWVAEKGHYVTQTVSVPVREKITVVDAPETTIQVIDGTIATFPEDGTVLPGHDKDKIAKHVEKLRSRGLSGYYVVRDNIIFKTIPAVTHTEFITIMKPKTQKKWVIDKAAHWEYEDRNSNEQ